MIAGTGASPTTMSDKTLKRRRDKRAPKNSYERWNQAYRWMKKPEDMTAEDISDNLLQPLAQWARSHAGVLNELYVQMNARVSTNITMPQISRWLSNKPEKRAYPSFGYGWLLYTLLTRIKTEHLKSLTPEGLHPDAVFKVEEKS